jgi:hypothetical protein
MFVVFIEKLALMNRKSKKQKSSKNLCNDFSSVNLGDIEAEKDDNLNAYFIESELYKKIKDFENSTSIIIGEKGTGKSAILQKISLGENNKKIIKISNNDLGILSVQTQLKQYLADDSFAQRRAAFKFLWIFIVCASVLKHYFDCKGWWDRVTTQHLDDKFKKLNDFFEITKTDNPLKFSVKAFGKFIIPKTPIEAGFEVKAENMVTESNELAQLLQIMDDFVNDIDKYIPDGKLYVLIDDLDAIWDKSTFSKLYIEGLIEAISSLNKKNEKFKVITTLLDSVFNDVDLRSKDKISGNYARNISWTLENCEKLMEERLKFHNILFSDIFSSDVNFEYIYKYTTGTPRDIIRFFQNCLETVSEKKVKLNKNRVDILVSDFSKIKLNELISECKERHQCDINPIITALRDGKRAHDYNSLGVKINKFLEIYVENEDYRIKNLLKISKDIKGLICFLYQRGFIGYATHKSNNHATYWNEDPSHKINEKFHYLIRNTYLSAMSIK